MYKLILLLLSVYLPVQNVWPFVISFPLLLWWLAAWLMWRPRFFYFKEKRNFERNPVINISKWFIYSIFTLCSSRNTFYERNEMVFTRHIFIEQFVQSTKINEIDARPNEKKQIDCVNSHNQHYIERTVKNTYIMLYIYCRRI